MEKIAIATLIKGVGENYNKWQETLVLIRNQSVLRNFEGSFDLILFHEGNLHPNYINKIKYSKKEWSNIKFVEVHNFKLSADELESLKSQILDIGNVRTGYSSMCRFWAYGFLDYLNEYDYVIRIDDDCIALNRINPIIEELKGDRYLTFPTLGNEEFRFGLKDYLKMYFDKPNIEEEDIDVPYTNFCGFNLKKIRRDKRIRNFFKEIENNHFIHRYSWNDTVLWGIVMKYFLKDEQWLEMKEIKYIHLSHLSYIN